MNATVLFLSQLYYHTNADHFTSSSVGTEAGLPWGWIIIGASMLLSLLVSSTMKSRMQEYSELPTPLSGRDIAERMLHENGIYDVQVLSTPGQLTDQLQPNRQDGKSQRKRLSCTNCCGRRCGGSRMRTCRTTRRSVSLAEPAFSLGAHG